MFYTEKEKKIELIDGYDVIVVGSGPSGMAAAIKSSESGCKTLLIEKCGAVGGISTTGMMSHFTGSVRSNLYERILKNAGEKNVFKGYASRVTIDPEMLKNTYYEMLSQAGTELLLYTFVCDVITEGNRVCGVITESKSGRRAYKAKIIIDCSGDGDVAFFAGAEYFKGREEDGKMHFILQ